MKKTKEEYKIILEKTLQSPSSPIVKIGEISHFFNEVDSTDLLLSEIIHDNYDRNTYVLFGTLFSAIKTKQYKPDEDVLNNIIEFLALQEFDHDSELLIITMMSIINHYRPGIYEPIMTVLINAFKKSKNS